MREHGKSGLPDEGTRSTGLGRPGGLGQYLQERYVWSLLLLFVCLFNSEESHFADKVQRVILTSLKKSKDRQCCVAATFKGFFFFLSHKKVSTVHSQERIHMTLLQKLYKAEAEQSSSRDTGFCFWRQKAETRALSALMTSALRALVLFYSLSCGS